MKRAVVGSLTAVLVLLLAVAAVAAWLVTTESGLRFVWNRTATLAAGRVEGAVSGRLIGPLIITDLEYAAEALRVTIDRVEIHWQPMHLLGRSFTVDRFGIQGVDVFPELSPDQPAADNAAPFRLPDSLVLPVDIVVESATLRDGRIHLGGRNEPVMIDEVSFRLHMIGEEWLIHELAATAPQFDLNGRVNVMPAGDWASEAELDWVVRPAGRPAARGHTVLFGNAGRLTLQQRVEPPYALDASVQITQPFTRPVLDGELEAGIALDEIGIESPATAVAANVVLQGGVDDLAVSGRAAVTAPDLADPRLEFDGRYAGEAVMLDLLRVTSSGSAAEIELAGRVDLRPQLAVDLGGEWSQLQWPLDGEPTVVSESGSLRVTGEPDALQARLAAAVAGGTVEGTLSRNDRQLGADLEWRNLGWPPQAPTTTSEAGDLQVAGTLDAYTLSLDAALAMSDGASGHVRAAGTGSTKALDLEEIDVAALQGGLTGRASVAWTPTLRGVVDLRAENLDPGIVAAEWSGRIGGRLAGSGVFEDGRVSVELDDVNLSGRLRGRPFDLDARGGFSGDAGRIDTFALRSGETRVEVSGTVGDAMDIEWSIDSPELRHLHPDLAGRLDARGAAVGPRSRPVVSFDISGDALELFGAAVEQVRASAQVDVAGEGQSEVELTVRDARYEDWQLERVDITGSGDAARHSIRLSAAGQGAETEIELGGTVEQPWQPGSAWRIELQRAFLSYAQFAPWTLRNPSSISVTRAGVSIEETCWSSGDADLCIEGAQQPSGTNVRFALTDLPFGYFAPLYPQGGNISGTMQANGRVALLPGEAPQLDIDIATSRGRIAPELIGGGIAGLGFGVGAANVTWNGQQIEASLDWPLERERGRLELRAMIDRQPGLPFAASELEGRAVIRITDLRFLSDLVASVADTGGSISGDIGLSGTVGEPVVTGRVELNEGTARLRGPEVVLEDVHMALVGDGRGGIGVEVTGNSGGGTFEADGELSLQGSLPVGYVTVRGESFELFNTPDAHVFVSPDLRLELMPERLDLTGDVLVPAASITPRGSRENAIQVSPDQVFVGAEEAQTSGLTRPLYAQIQFALGDDVTFQGYGLTGRLAGALEIIEVPEEPTTGSGELRVEEGTYEAYGQELEIRTGRVIFAGGALTRPGVDIEAVRRPAEGILVGARVTGTLRQPELSVFSEPAMARQEQLSYLVLGRALDSASASETSALSQAAMALGLRGGNFVSERLNESLGFDEFGIQTPPGEASSAASFVIGKYLSPSLYVSYGIGLFEPVNTLRLRYTISSRWRLVTESSAKGSGGDLIYHIERR